MHTLRNAKPADIPKLLDLLTQVNMVHHNGRPDLFNGPATKYTAEELKEMLHDAARPIFVCADESDTVLGYAFCMFQRHENDHILTDITTLYIDDICVDEAARGKHVGKSLYEHVLAFAKKSGCYNVTLNVWALNPVARKFYESLGMQVQKLGMEQIL